MKREVEKLLGGWAAGTLTDEERRALMDAALEDQALFDQLAAEQPLKEALEDPAIRERIHSAATERRRGLFAWHWAWGAAAGVAAVSVLTVAVFRSEYGIGVRRNAPAEAVLEQSRPPAGGAPQESAAKPSSAPRDEMVASSPEPQRYKREPSVADQPETADARVAARRSEPPRPTRLPAPAAPLAEPRIGRAGAREEQFAKEEGAAAATLPPTSAQPAPAGQQQIPPLPVVETGRYEIEPGLPEATARAAGLRSAQASPAESLRTGEAGAAEGAGGGAGIAPGGSKPAEAFATRQVISTAAVESSPLRYRVERRDAGGRFVPVDTALPLSASDAARLVFDVAAPARVTVSAGQTVLWDGTARPGRERRIALPAGTKRLVISAAPERGGPPFIVEVEFRYE